MEYHLDELCLTCRIIRGEVPSLKVIETELCLVILDIGPASEGHSLIIPKYHCDRMDEVPDEFLREVGPLAKKIAIANDSLDYNIIQNNGVLAWQTMRHVQFHVIPKRHAQEGVTALDWERDEKSMSDLTESLLRIQNQLPVYPEEESLTDLEEIPGAPPVASGSGSSLGLF